MCNSCASLAGLVLSFIACFSLLVIAPLIATTIQHIAIRRRVSVDNVIEAQRLFALNGKNQHYFLLFNIQCLTVVESST